MHLMKYASKMHLIEELMLNKLEFNKGKQQKYVLSMNRCFGVWMLAIWDIKIIYIKKIDAWGAKNEARSNKLAPQSIEEVPKLGVAN